MLITRQRYSSAWRAWAISCVVDWMLWSSVVWWCKLACPDSPTTPHVTSVLFSLEANQLYFFFSLHLFSFTLTILIFFIQTQNFKNKRILIEVFKISHNLKSFSPNTLKKTTSSFYPFVWSNVQLVKITNSNVQLVRKTNS